MRRTMIPLTQHKAKAHNMASFADSGSDPPRSHTDRPETGYENLTASIRESYDLLAEEYALKSGPSKSRV